MEPPVITGRPPAATDWRCADPGCKTLLGKKHSHGDIILKYKDFLAEVSGNYTLSVTCRKCGIRNILSNQTLNLLDMVRKE
jgi:hypothetical protein